MATSGLFSTEQIALIKKLYLAKLMPSRLVLAGLNAEFETTFTARQLASFLSERGWSSQRKQVTAGTALTASDLGTAVAAKQRADLSISQTVVAAQLKLGQTIMTKAQKYVDLASSGKSLSSAASAAKSGVSIARSACGLESSGSVVVNAKFDYNFAHSINSPFNPDSEFARSRAAPKAVVDSPAVPSLSGSPAIVCEIIDSELADPIDAALTIRAEIGGRRSAAEPVELPSGSPAA